MSISTELENLRIVLVNPRSGRNVGSVCRSMKTMGITNLVIVGDARFDIGEAERAAVHAFDVLERASFSSDLDSALEDTHLAAGVTRRRGKRRKYFSILPEELAERVAQSSKSYVAIVFGNEESGLTDRELSSCNLAVHIPTSSLFPSLNLSHAVQVITYEIFRRATLPSSFRYTPVDRKRLNALVATAIESLTALGFFKQVGSYDMEIFLRDILCRAQLSGREATRIREIFKKISGLYRRRNVR